VKRVDVFLLAGSKCDPDEELAAASRIWSQCGIVFSAVSRRIYNESQTRKLLATKPGEEQLPVNELKVVVNPDELTTTMSKLRNEWLQTRRAEFGVFFAPRVFLTTSGAPSAADPEFDIVYIGVRQHSVGWELAHELGHRLIGPEIPHGDLESPLMRPNRPGDEIVDLECRAARGDHRARFEIMNRGEQSGGRLR
jgi:hypothetical protein